MILLLIKYGPYIAVALAFLALLVGFQARGTHIKLLEAHEQVLQTQLQASQGSVKQLQAAIDEQNIKIQEIKTAADNRVLAHQAAVKEAAIARNSANLAANNLLKKVADPSKTACENADDLINKELSK